MQFDTLATSTDQLHFRSVLLCVFYVTNVGQESQKKSFKIVWQVVWTISKTMKFDGLLSYVGN